MTVLLGLDDTDMPGTPGTGRLARTIASVIADLYPVLGITRHQLLIDPAIPYTSHNSSAVIHIDAGAGALAGIAATARDLVLDAFAPGADPGIAAVEIDAVPPALVAFGQDAKRCVLTADQAFRLAANGEIFLEPLGGTGGGAIGALAGVGLASTGHDGRYLAVGAIRSLGPETTVEAALAAGIGTVVTPDGRTVIAGRLICEHGRGPKPAVIQGRPVLIVEECRDGWRAVRRD